MRDIWRWLGGCRGSKRDTVSLLGVWQAAGRVRAGQRRSHAATPERALNPKSLACERFGMRAQLIKCVESDAFQLGKCLGSETFGSRVSLAQMFRTRNIWSWHELMPRLQKRHTVAFGCLAGGQRGHSTAATPKRTLSPKCVDVDAFHSGKCRDVAAFGSRVKLAQMFRRRNNCRLEWISPGATSSDLHWVVPPHPG
jgi:hypothetical protein